MNIESYIKAGDEISVMFRSLALIGFCGTVLEVLEGEPGARAIVIERADDFAVGDRIATVHEDKAVFSVCRGDSWVDVPCLLSLAEAEAKAGRAVVNEQKRIQKKVPLFADQVPVNRRSAAKWLRERGAPAKSPLQCGTTPPIVQPCSGRWCRNGSRQASTKRSSHPVSATQGVGRTA